MDAKDDRIVSLAGYHRDMLFPAINEVQAYWEALRGGRQVPLRSEVDPRGIERALEYAFVLERVAPQVSRFRLAGMHLNDLMGMEVRGMPITSFFTSSARTRIAEIIERMFQGPEIADLRLIGEGGMGKPPIEARLLILPLKSDLGDISRALGCLVSNGQIGRTPRRFELVEARITPITAGEPAADADRTTTRTNGLISGLAEAPAPFISAPMQRRSATTVGPAAFAQTAQKPRGRGHLRLVKSDD